MGVREAVCYSDDDMKRTHFDDAAIAHLGKLARIKLGKAEIKGLRTDLNQILDYVNRLQQVQGVTLPEHAQTTQYREDTLVAAWYEPTLLTKNIPTRSGNAIVVAEVFAHVDEAV